MELATAGGALLTEVAEIHARAAAPRYDRDRVAAEGGPGVGCTDRVRWGRLGKTRLQNLADGVPARIHGKPIPAGGIGHGARNRAGGELRGVPDPVLVDIGIGLDRRSE